MKIHFLHLVAAVVINRSRKMQKKIQVYDPDISSAGVGKYECSCSWHHDVSDV